MARQGAPIADQMTEQGELAVRHRLLRHRGDLPGDREVPPGAKLIQPPPPLDGEELVIGGRPQGPSKARRQTEHRFPACRERPGHDGALDLEGLVTQGPDREAILPRQLLDGNACTGIGQRHQSVSCQTAAFPQVR